MDDALTLSYAETEALVRVMHDVGERGEKALLARFKYFQRMDFPHRAKVGRGSRVGYAFEDVLLLSLAFQLMELGISPARIVAALQPNWPDLRRILHRAHAACTDGSARSIEMLVAIPRTLSALGDEDLEFALSKELLVPAMRSECASWLEPSLCDIALDPDHRLLDNDRICLRVEVDPFRLVRLIISVLPRVSRVTREELDHAFSLLGE